MLKMLVVDDQTNELEGITGILKWNSLGIEIAGFAHNGQEGLEKALSLKPDIVITDVVMPHLDGLAMIEEIRKLLPNVKFIVSSCHDEFNYARSAIDLNAFGYILKPLIADDLNKTVLKVIEQCNHEKQRAMADEVMEKQLNESLPLLKDKFLTGIIFGMYTDWDDVWNDANFLQLRLIRDMSFCVLYLEVDDFKQITEKYSPKNKQLLLLNIRNIVQEHLDGKQSGYIVPVDECRFAVIMTLRNGNSIMPNRKDLMEIINSMVGELKQRLGLSFTVGVGSTVDTICELEVSYKSAVDAARLKFKLGKGQIIRAEDQITSQGTLEFHVDNLRKDIKNLLISGCDNDIKKFVDNVAIPQDKHFTEPYIQFVCISIVNFTQLVLIDMGESFSSVFDNENQLYEKLSHIETIIDIRMWLKNVLEAVHGFIRQKGSIRSKKIADRIQILIEENYARDLSIDDIAHEVDLSPSYMSYTFKQETGKNIIEYLNGLRIEKAMELLKNPEIKIYQISEMVGYKSTSYFCMLFKGKTNITPKEYRDNICRLHTPNV